MSHTPIPWDMYYIGDQGIYADSEIFNITADKGNVGVADMVRKADANLICRAVNAHADLVAALETLLGGATHSATFQKPFALDARGIKAARAALAKAKGESA